MEILCKYLIVAYNTVHIIWIIVYSNNKELG